eukprot:m.118807 g.118807  ORF g.118807 m.118807 type:complete len:61 (-) comp13260_c1_seq1:1362-1544(-)
MRPTFSALGATVLATTIWVNDSSFSLLNRVASLRVRHLTRTRAPPYPLPLVPPASRRQVL